MSQALRTCPLCDAADFKELYVTRDRHYGISGTYRVVRCVRCFLVMLNPMYSDRELAALYPRDYYAYQDKFRMREWRELARKLLGYHVGTKDPRFEVPGSHPGFRLRKRMVPREHAEQRLEDIWR